MFGIALFAARASGTSGGVMPRLSNCATAAHDRPRKRLSYLYVANIVGSAAGSLITGFVFMDKLTTMQTSSLLVCVGFAVAAALYVASRPGRADSAIAIASAAVLAFGFVRVFPIAYDLVYERIYFKT